MIETWSRVQKRGVSKDCGSMSRYGRKKLVALASSHISSTWSSTFLFLDFLVLDYFYFYFYFVKTLGASASSHISSSWSRTLLWLRFFHSVSQETSSIGALNPETKTLDTKPYTLHPKPALRWERKWGKERAQTKQEAPYFYNTFKFSLF